MTPGLVRYLGGAGTAPPPQQATRRSRCSALSSRRLARITGRRSARATLHAELAQIRSILDFKTQEIEGLQALLLRNASTRLLPRTTLPYPRDAYEQALNTPRTLATDERDVLYVIYQRLAAHDKAIGTLREQLQLAPRPVTEETRLEFHESFTELIGQYVLDAAMIDAFLSGDVSARCEWRLSGRGWVGS